MSYVCRYTQFGRAIYAVGGNEESANMMGVHVDRVKIIIFTLSGTFAAISGLVLAGRLGAGQPNACGGWEMTIMAAVVIGGTRVRGGVGNISGIFFGSIFVAFISNIINLNGHISAYWKDVLTGVVLLIAVLLQTMSENMKQDVRHKGKRLPQRT
jgi:ribose/xylose/arabinose/galactoside ABC-type transport system permease subunit